MDEPRGSFGRALRHRAFLLLAIVVAFILAGTILNRATPPVYEGTATLFIDVAESDAAQQSRDQLSRYFIQLVRTRPLLTAAVATLPVRPTPEALARQVRAEVVRGTGVVAVHAEAPTAGDAATLANALVRAMIDRYKADVTGGFRSSREYLDLELTRLDAAIQQVRAEAIPPTNAQALADHQARLGQLQSQYDTTYRSRQDLAVREVRALQVVRPMEPAIPPRKPLRPDPVAYLVAALVAGVSVGVLVILLIERFDDRLFSADDLARATGTPFVMSIPRFSRKALSGGGLIPYRVARAHLLARRPGVRAVMIAAASTRDRSDYVAAQLGSVAADSGQRVLVVHAESLIGNLPVPASQNGPLLTTVPVMSPDDTQVAIEALDQVGGRYDFAVLSVGSPDTNPSAFSLARSADLAVLVATTGVTRFAAARRAAESLRQAGVDLVACFLFSDGRAH